MIHTAPVDMVFNNKAFIKKESVPQKNERKDVSADEKVNRDLPSLEHLHLILPIMSLILNLITLIVVLCLILKS